MVRLGSAGVLLPFIYVPPERKQGPILQKGKKLLTKAGIAMILPPRPTGLSSKDRSKEKTVLVLEWLIEFRISTLDILSALIGHKKPKASSRFFQILFSKQYIIRVKSPTCERRNLVVIGPAGARYIDGPHRDRSREVTRAIRIIKKEHLTHDLEVQKSCLKLVARAVEIVESRNIEMVGIRPDALVWLGSSKLPHAIEYERWKKNYHDMYKVFLNYLDLIKDNRLAAVVLYFANEDDMNIYKNAFNETYWPYFEYDKKGERIYPEVLHNVPTDHPVRKRFHFVLQKVSQKAHVVATEESSKPKTVPLLGYKDRILEESRIRRVEEDQQERREREEREREALFAAEQKAANERLKELERKERRRIKTFETKLAELKKQDASVSVFNILYTPKAPAFEATRDTFRLEES